MVTLVPFATILMVLTTMCQGPLGRDKNRLTGDIIHCIESPTAALHWAAVYLHMTTGQPPQKNVRQVVFFKEQITLTIINRREGGENTFR